MLLLLGASVWYCVCLCCVRCEFHCSVFLYIKLACMFSVQEFLVFERVELEKFVQREARALHKHKSS